MIRNLRGNKGFTLIELMIVVAIIGILAAIAIPNFVAMQLRSKRSELPSNIDAIRSAEKAYEHEWDSYTSAGPVPSAGVPAKEQVTFSNADDGGKFALLGWQADGKVRGQYTVSNIDGGATLANNDFSAVALGDIDGDATYSDYRCNKDIKAIMVSANNLY